MAFNTGLLHAQLGGSRSADGISYVRGVDNLVVGLVSFTGDNSAGSVTVWLNPSLGEVPNVGGVTRSVTTSTSAWSALYVRGGSTWQGQVDEVRIGTSFYDVVPVPEPTSALLAVCGAIGLLLMRRRRAFVENA